MKFYTSWHTVDLFLFKDLILYSKYTDEWDVITYEDFIKVDEKKNPSLRTDTEITDSGEIIKGLCEVHLRIHRSEACWNSVFENRLTYMVFSFPYNKCAFKLSIEVVS